jgi:hypothetical protein
MTERGSRGGRASTATYANRGLPTQARGPTQASSKRKSAGGGPTGKSLSASQTCLLLRQFGGQ